MRRQPRIEQRDITSGTELPGIHPVLQRIYAAREIRHADELRLDLEILRSFETLKDIDRAAALLADSLATREKILVVGDFDADGATSSALAVRALRMMGAAAVDYLVPNRFQYGYGLTPEIVTRALENRPDLIITVDNGISSIAGVAAAKQNGIKVLITDHHLAGAEIPAADAIVNPNQPGDRFPEKSLAGVGVIFYVMIALRNELRRRDWFAQQQIPDPNLALLLDLVALGTVADVVPLEQNNRILVAQGLQRIRRGQACPGILALLQVANRSRERVNAADLGFAVGPRLNAAGRLTDMSVGIECLLADDPSRAMELAGTLNQLNLERRDIEGQMKQQAERDLDRFLAAEDKRELPPGLCLYDESWHQGVVGILASRIKEKYFRPVIAFARDGETSIKGSARSIPGLHIRDLLDAIATRHPGLISKFGGHAMAAGLSLQLDQLQEFEKAFHEQLASQLTPADMAEVILTDGELASAEITLATAELLQEAGPWGQGFPEPVFEGSYEVLGQQVVGENHLRLTLRVSENSTVSAIAFNQADQVENKLEQIRFVYRLNVNEFNGNRSVQMIVEYIDSTRVAAPCPS